MTRPVTTPREEQCPQAATHTPRPSGYLEWQAWALRMSSTHRQKRCEGCGLWKVWVPKKLRVPRSRHARRTP